jgi:hypothetical protein
MSAADLGMDDKVSLLSRVLRARGLPHAFGGALALNYYAEPRATNDIDLNVFLPVDRMDELLVVLAELDVEMRADQRLVAERDGQVRLFWGEVPLDLFFAYDPFHAACDTGAREVPWSSEPMRILGPLHLLVCKVVFNRRKDWLDIEQILFATSIDLDEARHWIERIVGPDDVRLAHYDEVVAEIIG